MNIVALALATAIPLVFLYVIYALDLYKTGTFKYVLVCFIWGVIAFQGASIINRTLQREHILSTQMIIRLGAPIIEETLKALILLYLVRRPSFTYFVDGAIYGFAAGIGFAVFENYQYILGSNVPGISVAIGRVLSTNLIHASASALVGIAFGYSRFQRSWKKVLYILAGFVAAALLHTLYNNVVSEVKGGIILLYAAVFGFGGAGLIAFMIRRGLAEEKVWIEQSLNMTDRVTHQEKAYVNQLADISEVLEPMVKRFGDDKVAEIENFLTLQARLGIQRKTLSKLTDERMRKAVEAQMNELRKEMDVARRKVGSYVMLYLRHTVPPDTSPLWGKLENLIQERAAARPATGGMNLWSTLSEKAAAPAATKAEAEAAADTAVAGTPAAEIPPTVEPTAAPAPEPAKPKFNPFAQPKK